MSRRGSEPAVPLQVLGVHVLSETVLDFAASGWPAPSVSGLDDILDLIAREVREYRVRPVEVGLYDGAAGPALFLALGSDLGFAVYHATSATELPVVEYVSVGREVLTDHGAGLNSGGGAGFVVPVHPAGICTWLNGPRRGLVNRDWFDCTMNSVQFGQTLLRAQSALAEGQHGARGP